MTFWPSLAPPTRRPISTARTGLLLEGAWHLFHQPVLPGLVEPRFTFTKAEDPGMGTIQVLDTGLEGIEVILVALYRSVFWGSLATLPCVVAVTANLAMMGWLGIPLGVATSMFAAVALGIGDSFSIHLIERYRFALARGQEPAAALGQALRVVGPASSVDAMTVVAGLGILTLSQVPANARLGMMSVVTIASCFLTTLIVLPPLISASGSAPRFAPTAQE